MGVHGLWRLIEPSGKKVPLETLENRVLAVDISIWLHQAIKGFQDSRGASVPNAHLLGVYHRICKLLYYKIRPIFVFDGGVPILKKQTITKRNQQRNKLEDVSSRLHQQILSTLLKQSAISNTIHEKEKLSPVKNKSSPIKQSHICEDDELFKLPELPSSQQMSVKTENECESESSDSDSDYVRPRIDIDSVDEKSHHFRSLPADIRHDILTELIENSKVSSWHKIRQMPSDSGDFSKFQIKQLLKKHSIQISLEEAEKEMGGHTLSLGDLEVLLTEEGIVTASKNAASTVVSDENTKYLLIKDIQKALIKAKQDQEAKEKLNVVKTENLDEDKKVIKPQLEEAGNSSKSQSTFEAMHKLSKYEYDLQNAIKLSLNQNAVTSNSNKTKEENDEKIQNNSYLENFNDLDFVSDTSSDEEIISPLKKSPRLSKSYMIEYSGLTPAEIDNILGTNSSKSNSQKYFMNEMLLNTPKLERKNDAEKTKSVQLDAKEIINLKSVPVDITHKIVKKSLFNNSSDQQSELLKNTSECINSHKSEEICNILESEASDESNDLIEVSDCETKTISKNTNTLEIVIQPHSEIIDDLFSDIFNNPSKVESISNKKPKISNSKKECNIVESVNNNKDSKENNTLQEPVLELKPQTNPIYEHNQIEATQNESIEFQSNDTFLKVVTSDSDKVTNIDQPLTKKKVENIKQPILTTKELESMHKSLQKEHQELINEKAHQDRMASSITDQMYKDAQELLELFGLPYIIAPMEAEAQCAFLESIKLTDGTITDDSDIWLFGGQKVYKNFFSQKKQVLEFQNENIKYYFKLTRQQLILLALLVGSDYTLGIQGVGPVTALEILAAFPSSNSNVDSLSQDELISGLKDFKNWWDNGKPVGVRKTTLKNKLKNITLSEGFPNIQVINAYLYPEVETSSEKFSWGKPNLNKLIHYSRLKFGWSEKKSTEILLPILKRLEDTQVQKSIKAYFATQPTVMSDKKMSKRVQLAVQRIEKKIVDSDEDDLNDVSPPEKKIRKKTSKNNIVKEVHEENNQFKEYKKERVTKMPKNKSKIVNEPNVITMDVEIKPIQQLEKKNQITSTSKKYTEIIPQREKDKLNALKTKLKAIETYRKSKHGPGYLKKRKQIKKVIKNDAELSESSSDE